MLFTQELPSRFKRALPAPLSTMKFVTKTYLGITLFTFCLIVLYYNMHPTTTKVFYVRMNFSESFAENFSDVLNVSISEELRKIIPQDGAYWNRQFDLALKSLDNNSDVSQKVSSWFSCRENHEAIKDKVHDFASYPALFQSFLQGMDCGSPPVLIDQPNICSGSTYLLFAIKSSPANFQRRQAVRETWGRSGVFLKELSVRTVFLLGSSSPLEPDLSALLSFEAKQYRDIVQWDFHESLLNLTLKMHMFFQWTKKRCPLTSFVFSGDDDVFVNTDGLLQYLQSVKTSEASQLYVGEVIKHAGPHRNPKIKYYIPKTFYNGPYPDYAGGGGFIISGELLQQLSLVSRVLPFYPIDDVYVGMCMKALGVTAMRHGGFRTFDIQQKDREDPCIHKYILLVHQRLPREIKLLWKGINNPSLRC